MGKFDALLDTTFKLEEREGPDKVMGLTEAVKRHIKSEMKLHLSGSYYSPNAIVNEITRQFWGKRPNITLICNGINLNTINLLEGDIVSKAITTFHGDVYPAPRPNPAIIKALKENRIKIEEWSLYTLNQRLMAGACGFGFIPTNSIVGSSMAEENREDFRLIEDPFENEGKSAVLKALHPDISVLHGWAADPFGNTIVLPPHGGLPWGAMAAGKGVMVTVERIVSTEFIRRHSHFVILPGHFVRSVSVIPFGAHPQGMSNLDIDEFDTYEWDYEFIEDFQKATRRPEDHQKWLRTWVLDCNTQEDYLRKLGDKKIFFLKGKAQGDSWVNELRSMEKEISRSPEYNPLEMMTVAASRKLKEKAIDNGYRVILSGVGTANLAAWMGYYQLKEEGHFISLAAEMGFLGYSPRPVDPFIFSFKNLPSCKMVTDVVNVLGVFVGGRNNRCIGSLGAGQIDRYGNINSTRISAEFYLTGSGGSNDVASSAAETIVVVEQSPDRFVERVPYITCPGHRVKTVVSDMGIFEKLGDDKELTLTQYFPGPDVSDPQKIVENIKQKCGWDLKVSKNIGKTKPPTRKELETLRLFDPKGYFLRC